MAFNNPDEIIKKFNLSYQPTRFINLKENFVLDVPRMT